MTDLKSNKKRKGHPQVINPVGEFCLPITLPDDPEWVAAFINAIRKLSNRSTWDYDPTGDYIVLADRWKEIADTIQLAYQNGITCEAEICEDGSCTEIGAFHPAISYFPNNPITQPDEEGVYASPPWITGAGFIGATGADAMIDIAAFLGASWETLGAALLPSWTLNFDGAGEIDVQFLSTIQGGACWLYPDGNPLVGDLINLEYTDITSLFGIETLGELYEIIIQGDVDAFVITHSITFETAGPHTLTAQYFPTAELFEPPFVGIGGGLRSIQLCGGASVAEDIVVPYTLDAQPDGTIRLLADGIPVSTLDLKALLDDDYVNTEGDTMTGRLTMNADTQPAMLFKADGVNVANLTLGAASSFRYYNGKNFAYQGLAADGSQLQLSDQIVYLRNRRDSASFPGSGAIRLGAYDATVGFNMAQFFAGGDIQHWHELTALRASLTAAGVWRGAAYDGYDYSSVGLWRQQFKLTGTWVDDTDATRKGGLALSVDSYEGAQEIMRVDRPAIDNNAATLSFFEGPGFRPALVPYASAEELSENLAEVLKQYGLIDSYNLYGTTPPDLTFFEKCNAAHYIAGQVQIMIQAGYDGFDTGASLYDVFQAILQNVIIYRPDIVGDVIGALLGGLISAPAILADIADVTDLGNDIYADDFDLVTILTDVAAYAWDAATIDVVSNTLTAVWDGPLADWIEVGKAVQSPECVGGADLPCTDYVYDFRLGNDQGWVIQDGTLTFGLGIEQGYNDPFYRVFTEGYFDACPLAQVKIKYYCANTAQTIHVLPYEKDGMGGYQLLGLGYFNSPTLGHNEMVITFGVTTTVDLLRIRFESEGVQYNNYFKTFEIVVAG